MDDTKYFDTFEYVVVYTYDIFKPAQLALQPTWEAAMAFIHTLEGGCIWKVFGPMGVPTSNG